MLGIFGNLTAVTEGYRMGSGLFLSLANGLWVVAVAVMAGVTLPGARRLAKLCQEAVEGNAPDGYDAALKRWRTGNGALSVLYLALLALMVLRPLA